VICSSSDQPPVKREPADDLMRVFEVARGDGDMTRSPGRRPLLNLIQGSAESPDSVLAEVKDFLREQAIRLPGSDPWREALLGIADDLSQALEQRAHGLA
jgi:hypothetical protein